MLKINTIGDLSRSFALQSQTGNLKASLDRLGYEVTTGQTRDVAKSVNGDFLPLASIEASLARLDRYQTSISEASVFLETGQRALETVQDRALRAGTALLTVSTSAEITVVGAVARDTRQGFHAVVSAMNSQIGGRGVFGGMSTNMASLGDAEQMLASVEATIVGLTSAQDIVAAVNSWFDDPGAGFETIGYTGSDNSLLPFELGLGDVAEFDFKSDDQEIRDILKGFAIGALMETGASAIPTGERQALVRSAGEMLLTAEKNLANYRAEIGTAEAATSEASVRTSTEIAALSLARAQILNVDQYAAAGELDATQTQLEMLYTITARMSRLSLMEYLR